MIPSQKRSFPLWLEAVLTVALLGMAIQEANHGAWGWTMIFGGGFLTLTLTAVINAFSGGTHGKR